MVSILSLNEDYWEAFQLNAEDFGYLYSHLLELEVPLTSEVLLNTLITHRIQQEKISLEKQRSEGASIYFPKDDFNEDDSIVFPAFNWTTGKVLKKRKAKTIGTEEFDVISVQLDDGTEKDFAANLSEHLLNATPETKTEDPLLDLETVLKNFGENLLTVMREALSGNDDFVYIAGRWFPSALLVDINIGHLNLAEAVLDMAGGGPLPTKSIMEQLDLPEGENEKLLEFSLDLALQEDERFDEVGSSGIVMWYLKRLEPEEVKAIPMELQYSQIEYDRSLMSDEMIRLEKRIDDELTVAEIEETPTEEVELRLIYPHWKTGTIPLSRRMEHIFPTALESPRVRFQLIDGDTGEKFAGWVVLKEKYIFGLKQWYEDKGLMPGSIIWIKKGENQGEIIIKAESHRSTKEWVRTALIGADGGVVYATLKQHVYAAFDERMMIHMPDEFSTLVEAWEKHKKSEPMFEQVIVDTLRELAKLNPQSHVHARELYSAMNLVMRVPPGPILAMLASRPWFVHVGDLHFRFDDSTDTLS